MDITISEHRDEDIKSVIDFIIGEIFGGVCLVILGLQVRKFEGWKVSGFVRLRHEMGELKQT